MTRRTFIQPEVMAQLVIAGTIQVSRDDLQKLAQRYHIRRLALFGSESRGELNMRTAGAECGTEKSGSGTV